MISHWFTIGCYNVGGVTHRNSLQGLWPHGRRGSTAEVLNLLRLADLASNFEAIWTAPFRQPLDQLDSLFSWDKARGVGKKKLEFPAARFGSCVFFLAFEWLWLCKSKYAYAIKRLPSESPAWKCMAIFCPNATYTTDQGVESDTVPNFAVPIAAYDTNQQQKRWFHIWCMEKNSYVSIHIDVCNIEIA